MNLLEVFSALFDIAAGTATFAVTWLVQSTLLIGCGLIAARLFTHQGAAVRSAIYRTTLVAALICPLATWALSQAGFSGWTIALSDSPATANEAPAEPAAALHITGAVEATDVDDSPELLAVADGQFADSGRLDPGESSVAVASSDGAANPSDSSVDGVASSVAASSVESAVGRNVDTASMIDAAVLGAWMLGAIVLLTKVTVAWRRLTSIRRNAVPVEDDLTAACQSLAKDVGVAAPAVRRSPYVASPCLAGLLRPVILLPEDTNDLSIREVLIHELAHLRRRDCHWNLLRRIASSVLFFQPLIWKLSQHIEVSAEEVCDDYVVQLGGDRETYAQRLVDIAELSVVPAPVVAVGMVSVRSVLAQRVTRILDTSRALSTRVERMILLVVLVGGMVAASATGLIGTPSQAATTANVDAAASDQESNNTDQAPTAQPVADQDATAPQRANNQAAESDGASGKKDPTASETRFEFAGQVVGPDGTPVAAANVYYVFYFPESDGLLVPKWKPVATTSEDGQFQFTAAAADFGPVATFREFGYASLVAVKPGFGLNWTNAAFCESSGKWLARYKTNVKKLPDEYRKRSERALQQAGQPIRLYHDALAIRARVVDEAGAPIQGIRVSLYKIYASENGDLSAWRKAAAEEGADFYSARRMTPRILNGPAVRSLVRPVETDNDGRFELKGIGPGSIAELLIEGPAIESALVRVRTEQGDPVVLRRSRRNPDLGSTTYHPAEFTFVTTPSTAITGIVRDGSTNEPLKGVTIKSQTRHGDPISGLGQDFVRTTTDAEGRYTLRGMPIGPDNHIAAVAPNSGNAYFSVNQTADTTADERTTVDFNLPRGVWLKGRVTDKETGKGVNGRLTYNASQDNPHLKQTRSLNVDERDRLRTDDQGCFRIAALPGPGYVSFMADTARDYPRAKGIVKLDGSNVQAEHPIQAAKSIFSNRNIWIAIQNNHIVAEINPAEDSTESTLHLELDKGLTAMGRAVDPEGQPVVDYYHTGRLKEFPNSWEYARDGRFMLSGYDQNSERHVYLIHHERKLAGHTVIRGELPDDLVVTLQPSGQVAGRLVNEDGEPLANWRLIPDGMQRSPLEPGDRKGAAPPLPPRSRRSYWDHHETDAEGRFSITGLVPGVTYRVNAFFLHDPAKQKTPDPFSGRVDVDILVQPKESKDLGDVTLAVDKKKRAKADRRPR